jgi:restriction system protein
MQPPRPIIESGEDLDSSLLTGQAATGRQVVLHAGAAHITIFAPPVTFTHTSLQTPSILLQAVVIMGQKTEDGSVIEALSIPWLAIMKMIEIDPSVVYQIEARKWEELIAAWYDEAGFDEVILTPRSGDLGRDVIAVKRGLFTVRLIDQIKAYKPGHLVTAEEVRALGHVLQADQNATKGFVTTTSDFAPKIKDDKLIAPFMPYRLELVNGTKLRRRLLEVAKSVKGT